VKRRFFFSPDMAFTLDFFGQLGLAIVHIYIYIELFLPHFANFSEINNIHP
jgi:hypothetical protein